jgi:pimeloyl-ACP methyl ester carboxylesterase
MTATTRHTVELSSGLLEYEDTGGTGPTLVLLHGLLMDASLWDDVIGALAVDYRCIAPTLPLGAHRHAVTADADLSLRGIARLVEEFLGVLGVDDATLVGNDTGGAIVQLLASEGREHVHRIVLVSCDAFDNYPPGLTGKALVTAGKLPPALFGLFMQQMRLRPLRRLPVAFGRLTKRGDAATVRWLRPILTQGAIRRDTVRVLRSVAAEPDLLLAAADRLARFTGAALVAWAADDRVMPPRPRATSCRAPSRQPVRRDRRHLHADPARSTDGTCASDPHIHTRRHAIEERVTMNRRKVAVARAKGRGGRHVVVPSSRSHGVDITGEGHAGALSDVGDTTLPEAPIIEIAGPLKERLVESASDAALEGDPHGT